MSALAEAQAPNEVSARRSRISVDRCSVWWPLLAAAVNALAFFAVRPNVGDLQAALARQSAAANGVGLGYWFTWFGGGATPGNYSVVTPYLSSLIGAPLVGTLATIAITPLAHRALAGTPYRLAGTWVATLCAGMSLWSGRIPFALGLAVGVIALIGVRERRMWLAVLATVAATLCTPVAGAFVAFGLAAAFLAERRYRRVYVLICATCGGTLLLIMIFFGNPGSQTYSGIAAFLTSSAALFLLLARPSAGLRSVLWCTALAAPVLTLFPNGMGSNFERLPWVCLPAAVVAMGAARKWLIVLALAPALVMSGVVLVRDLVYASRPAAAKSYYTPLIRQLDRVPGRANYRLEVVQNPAVHTAAYALLDHASLAGGYETQEANKLNGLLSDPKRLNATSYHVWLNNNAVGYVALNVGSTSDSPEYQLLARQRLPYLVWVSGDAKWTLYRVVQPTPIVPAPQKLVKITQAELAIYVPQAGTFRVRVRYSKFLDAATKAGVAAKVANDGMGWTTVTTVGAGTYVLSGDVTHPLR